MGARPIGSGRRRSYILPGVWDHLAAKAKARCDASDPRLLLLPPGTHRDRLIEEDRLNGLFHSHYRRAKYWTADIERLEARLPVLVPFLKLGGNSFPDAKLWAEVIERSAAWFEVHPGDQVIPVVGAVDPATYWCGRTALPTGAR